MYFNFELILFYATLITGLIALADVLYFAKRRRLMAKKQGVPEIKMSIIVDYSRAFFPVLLIVFLLRSFLFEPFRIPSGSLEPTLLKGDFILVNKYKYGIRLPVIHTKILDLSEPKRGDIIVFRWPPNPSIDFIKRVIGVPGDQIKYINKELYINGKKMETSDVKNVIVKNDIGNDWVASERVEDLMGVKHRIYNDSNKVTDNFYNITVPEGMYFVMGDNRDDSADSRYWGFVPEKNIIGKAVVIWMSWNSDISTLRLKRIGKVIQ